MQPDLLIQDLNSRPYSRSTSENLYLYASHHTGMRLCLWQGRSVVRVIDCGCGLCDFAQPRKRPQPSYSHHLPRASLPPCMFVRARFGHTVLWLWVLPFRFSVDDNLIKHQSGGGYQQYYDENNDVIDRVLNATGRDGRFECVLQYYHTCM